MKSNPFSALWEIHHTEWGVCDHIIVTNLKLCHSSKAETRSPDCYSVGLTAVLLRGAGAPTSIIKLFEL